MSLSTVFARWSLLACACLAAACGGAAESTSRTADSAPASEQGPTSHDLLQLGLSFARAGEVVRGEQYLAAALEAGESPDAALLPLMQLCVRAGRFEAAAQATEAATNGSAGARTDKGKGKLEELIAGERHAHHSSYLRADADLRAGKDLIVAPEDAVARDWDADASELPSASSPHTRGHWEY